MLKKENLNENDEDLVSVITKTIVGKSNASDPINEAKSKNKIDEDTQLDESFMRIKSKSARDMVMGLKYALEIAERWAKGNDVDRNLLRGMEKTLSDQLKVLRSDIKTFNRKEDVPKEYMAEETELDENVSKEGLKNAVTKILVRAGNNPKDVKKMVDAEFETALKMYKPTVPDAKASKIADIIRTIAEETEPLDEDKYVHYMDKNKQIKRQRINQIRKDGSIELDNGALLDTSDKVDSKSKIKQYRDYILEDTQLDERVLPIFQKTHDELKSLEMKLKPGSRLNAGINRELNGNYNNDFAKMSKLLTPLVETWEFVVWNDLQMNLVRENTELDEAVNVSYDRYVRVHGKKPRVSGRAPFMFTSKSMGAVSFDDDTEVLMTPTMTAADAQKLAKEWGKKHGHRTVYFMESLEKSIEDLKKKPNDEEELKENVKIKNNTKSSDFIKILRAIAKDDLDARQFLNKLADHIKKSYPNIITDKDMQSLKREPALQKLWDDDTLDYVLISSGLNK